MSTPAKRAKWLPFNQRRSGTVPPRMISPGPGLRTRGYAPISRYGTAYMTTRGKFRRTELALTLLVAWIFADHHDHAITTDHLALIADRLHARVNLQGFVLWRLQLLCGAVNKQCVPRTLVRRTLATISRQRPSKMSMDCRFTCSGKRYGLC